MQYTTLFVVKRKWFTYISEFYREQILIYIPSEIYTLLIYFTLRSMTAKRQIVRKSRTLFTYEMFEVEDNLWAEKGKPRMNTAYGFGMDTSPVRAKEKAKAMFRTLWQFNVDSGKGCEVGCCILEYSCLKKDGIIIKGEHVPVKDKQVSIDFYHMILEEKKVA